MVFALSFFFYFLSIMYLIQILMIWNRIEQQTYYKITLLVAFNLDCNVLMQVPRRQQH